MWHLLSQTEKKEEEGKKLITLKAAGALADANVLREGPDIKIGFNSIYFIGEARRTVESPSALLKATRRRAADGINVQKQSCLLTLLLS